MKVIALRGVADTGKSHTINIVYTFLLRDGYVQVPGHFRILGNPNFEDVFDILEKGEVKVGFIGMGDYVTGQGRSLASLLEELDRLGCHVAICACRTAANIQSAVTHYPIHVFVDKTLSIGSANHRIVNVADATAIINFI